MIPDAARMRRWILVGAPATLLAGWGMRAGGGAAGLGLWLLLGVLVLPPGRYPYPRKRGGKPWRLFFAFSLGAFVLAGLTLALRLISRSFFASSPMNDFLALAGAVFFSLPLCAKALFAPLPRSIAWSMGLLLCAAALALTAGM